MILEFFIELRTKPVWAIAVIFLHEKQRMTFSLVSCFNHCESGLEVGFLNSFVFLFPAVRKRQKKEKDRAWAYEEPEPRRGTSSRSRYGDHSPDASDRESPPPPSLSDGKYIFLTAELLSCVIFNISRSFISCVTVTCLCENLLLLQLHGGNYSITIDGKRILC